MYVSKTTLVSIHCGWWTDKHSSFDSLVSATHAVAIQIAQACQMDIMSVSCRIQPASGGCVTTVVYVNNGMSLADICQTMAPFIDNNPRSYWMIQDIEEWQGMLDCVMSVKDTNEEWR